MSEVQSRWFVYLMTGKIKMPSREEMEKEMKEYRVNFSQEFYHNVVCLIVKSFFLLGTNG